MKKLIVSVLTLIRVKIKMVLLKIKSIKQQYYQSGGFSILNNKITIQTCNEWHQYFDYKRFNWITINFFILQYEDDIMCGTREILFMILGLGIRVSWLHETEKSKETFKNLEDSLLDLKNSFYAWADKGAIKMFRDKKWTEITLVRTRKLARCYKIKNPKKLFIQ